MDVTQLVLGLLGGISGIVVGHILAVRSQRLAWQREDDRRLQLRETEERIELSVEVRFVVRHGGSWLVELAALLDNKGLVRYETQELTFDLRCIYPEDALVPGPEIDGQTRIPHLLAAGSWLPAGWSRTFIEPGLSTRYSYVTTVPCSASAVLLHGRFAYEPGPAPGRASAFHTAETFQAVPEGQQPSGAQQ
ncbi:MAG TPA: hypothetical protein VFM55_20190 [Micromonosporaceae bacterium]|nr:hypothetical protein [Micromonosporaceae bacterium]